MTRLKKLVLLGAMVLTVGATSITAFAATSTTPAGVSASDLDEWKAQRLELKQEILSDRVEAGLMTQEQADAIIQQMVENQALCDGTGIGRQGTMMGRGNGGGYGQGYCGGGMGFGQGYRGGLSQTE